MNLVFLKNCKIRINLVGPQEFELSGLHCSFDRNQKVSVLVLYNQHPGKSSVATLSIFYLKTQFANSPLSKSEKTKQRETCSSASTYWLN